MHRWIRADGPYDIVDWPEGSRPQHLEMPPLTESLAYPMNFDWNDELAYCIPISWPDDGSLENRLRFEGFIKAALYLVRQMHQHWDMQVSGVPVFIGVSANGWDTFWQYARHCDFPLRNVVKLPSYQRRRGGWHIKFDLLNAEQVRQFRKLVHLDASLWLCGDGMRMTASGLLSAWDTQDMLIPDSSLVHRAHQKPRRLPWTFDLQRDIFGKISRAVGSTWQEEHDYWWGDIFPYCWGAVFGVRRDWWQREDIQSLLSRLCVGVLNDEPILAVLLREFEPTLLPNGFRAFFGDLQYVKSFSDKMTAETKSRILRDWRTARGYEV